MWHLPIKWLVAVVVGSTTVLTGLAMSIAAVAAFRSVRRMSGLQEDSLVDNGIYRYSRNPQNVGWAMVLLGISIIGRSGMGLLLTALFWLLFRLYLPFEERHLHDVFSVEYERYSARTRRYLGFPPK